MAAPAVFLFESQTSESFLALLKDFLVRHDIDHVYDGRNLLASAIYHYVSYFNQEKPAVLLRNIVPCRAPRTCALCCLIIASACGISASRKGRFMASRRLI